MLSDQSWGAGQSRHGWPAFTAAREGKPVPCPLALAGQTALLYKVSGAATASGQGERRSGVMLPQRGDPGAGDGQSAVLV